MYNIAKLLIAFMLLALVALSFTACGRTAPTQRTIR